MKLTGILILISFLQVSAKGYSQAITLSEKNAPLEKVFKAIEKQTGYLFWYDNIILKDAKKVTIEVKGSSLEQVLEICFKEQSLSYSIINKTVVVKKKGASQNNNADQPISIDVKGYVVNENGERMQGITVSVKGTAKATATNSMGEFLLNGVEENAVLIFSGTNIEYYEMKINGRSELAVTVKIRVNKLDEVKIIGYGTTTQRLSTGSVGKVTSDEISKQPVTNVMQALEGRVPGLQITQGNGLPGAPVIVQIRGRNSIAASNNPLFVVDGVPYPSSPVGSLSDVSGFLNSNSVVFGSSPLNSIAPSDIESVEILKDADATAIYGSRAANGVVLITTKKAKNVKNNLNLNYATSVATVATLPEFMNINQYLAHRRTALKNSNVTATQANAPDLLLWDTTVNHNWLNDFVGGTSNTNDFNVSYGTSSKQISFLLSGTYHKETSVLSGHNVYERSNFQTSIEHISEDKKFSLNTNIFYTYSNTDLSTGAILDESRLPPNYPVYDSSGNYYWSPNLTNPVAQTIGRSESKINNINGSLNLRYAITNDFSLKAAIGYGRMENNQISKSPADRIDPTFNPSRLGSSSFGNEFVNTFLFEPQASYKKDIFNGKLDMLAGLTMQSTTDISQTINNINYTSDLLLGSIAFGTFSTKSGSTVQYKYSSVFGKLGYTWENKYIFNGSFRRDGSSRFGPNNQFGNFYGLAGGWIFSKEPFLQKSKWLSYGKLRASYGTTGNDGIGDYAYLSTYQSTTGYGQGSSITPNRISNADFQWETNKKIEVGMELGMLSDRILFVASWYRNRSGNQLVNYALPAITGFTGYVANLPALVQNKGWEFEINACISRKSHFNWNVFANVSIPKNTLLSFPGLETSSYANDYVVGQPLDILMRYHFLGVDPQTGLPLTEDVNKDNVYTAKSFYNNQGGDYVIAGKVSPDLFGGFGSTLGYKNFQLDFFFQFTKQQGYSLIGQYGYNLFGRVYNFPAEFLSYWRQPGDVAKYPKPFASSNPDITRYTNSSALLTDASFVRFKNVFLSYSFAGKWVQKARLKKFTVFISGQNLFTITRYKGFDPETSTLTNRPLTPPLRTLQAGLKCSF